MDIESATSTGRALRLLGLLQDNPGISAELLASRLGITDRAVRRYVRLLRDADIPVESATGRYGGYRLGRGVRLPPLTFSAAEALGLVMAALDGHHDVSDPSDPVSSALSKLMRALPGPVAAQAEAVRRTTAPAPDRAAARPDPAITTALVQACADSRTVRLDYRSEAGSEWVTEVEPWAVVVRHGRWYLLCRSPATDARRAYRIDRVRDVEVLTGTFTPPADLADPVAALEQHLGAGWEYEAEIIIDAPVEVAGRCLSRTLGRLEPVDEGTCKLTGSTSNPVWYAEQLARVPATYQIIRCPEIQKAAQVLGERLLAAASPPARP